VQFPVRHDGPKRAPSWKPKTQRRKVHGASGLFYLAAAAELVDTLFCVMMGGNVLGGYRCISLKTSQLLPKVEIGG
jgi:hypothetical protein